MPTGARRAHWIANAGHRLRRDVPVDSTALDRLARCVARATTRRGLARLLLGMPLVGGLGALLGPVAEVAATDDDHGSSHRRRRRTRHGHRRNTTRNRKHKPNKPNNPNKPNRANPLAAPTCTPPCPVCQTCAPAGQCVADSSQDRKTCAGSAGTASVCCNGACCPGCCDRDGSCGACRVFATSTRHEGHLQGSHASGLEGADAICQQLAGSVTPPLPGTYQAWLSDSTASPATRFRCSAASCSSHGYVLVDGTTVVATDWADLTTCDPGLGGRCLAHGIDHTETGSLLGSHENVWTHTNPDGTAGGIGNVHCLDWSSNESNQSGSGGLPVAGHGDITWTRFKDSTIPCNIAGMRLYCFQQR